MPNVFRRDGEMLLTITIHAGIREYNRGNMLANSRDIKDLYWIRLLKDKRDEISDMIVVQQKIKFAWNVTVFVL